MLLRWLPAIAFCLTVPAANWTLNRYGFVHVPGLGSVPSGVAWVGLAFVLRDVAQLILGKWAVLIAIAVGALLSWWVSTPELASASMAAFAVSEMLDWSVYTPLAQRRFVLAVLASSVAGSCVDSALFLQLAYHSTDGWWRFAIAKSAIVVIVTPAVWWTRRMLQRVEPAGVGSIGVSVPAGG
jgi:uncharacterized PurR-regulated membrane protein YhhQ (DUF165 family)